MRLRRAWIFCPGKIDLRYTPPNRVQPVQLWVQRVQPYRLRQNPKVESRFHLITRTRTLSCQPPARGSTLSGHSRQRPLAVRLEAVVEVQRHAADQPQVLHLREQRGHRASPPRGVRNTHADYDFECFDIASNSISAKIRYMTLYMS